MKWKLMIAIAALALLAGCGVPGAPQPPSLELPRPVSDLSASRKGDRVTLAWTAPQETTDRATIRHPGATRICRATGAAPMAECQAVGELPAAKFAAGAPANYVDTLPPELQQQNPLGKATYAVEAENARGRSAGLSNQVQVPLAPTLPPPDDLKAEVTAEGIALSWTGILHQHEAPEMRHVYRIYRRAQGAPRATVAGEVQLHAEPAATFLDRKVDWERRYEYWVTVVTVLPGTPPVEVEGDDSRAVEVLAHDVFPPAVPSGLEAVYTPGAPGFIDLTWAPDTETDLAGYDVYRHEEGAAPVKINRELVKAPAFRDTQVEAGHSYFYSVSAVDLRGNESGRSMETNESVPK
jgi:hypothetical protein